MTLPRTSPQRTSRPLRAFLRVALRVVLAAFIILDEAVRPLYRPIIVFVARLRLVEAFSRWVASQSPYVVLLLLAIPYAIVEPFKIIALIWIAHGAVRLGVITIAVAYLLSFLVVERIYTAGKARLMTIPRLAWLIGTVSSVKASIVAWLHLDRLKREARLVLYRLRRLVR